MDQHKTKETLKLLCSYGGKILPRHTDGNLRYVGGLTRVLAVDASISFAELMVKLAEFCGYSVDLRCQLPDGDLETLISVKSDEELANIIEEYDRASSSSRPLKIRAILSPPKSLKQISPPMSMATSGGDLSPSKSLLSFTDSPPKRYVSPLKGYVSPPKRYASPPIVHPGPVRFHKGSGRVCYYPCHVQSNPSDMSYLPHHHHHHQHRHQHVPHCNDWR
ncbi:hypothetical protein PRUPE_5G166200 [Prunus persica]|uniref:PB1 domain-containing protein n=1 Tax=Prunus persica TaxID=3760 RepID=M5WNC6_PRUPE|nr:uncharacterized protein LOC18776621 [Prunus persica]ONI08231.1 hypothetical protein PRUPE_5G166200 [Prunus persica]ONI08232.1 hypothetical protein PRUPE_5G166200 [Prunus persica]